MIPLNKALDPIGLNELPIYLFEETCNGANASDSNNTRHRENENMATIINLGSYLLWRLALYCHWSCRQIHQSDVESVEPFIWHPLPNLSYGLLRDDMHHQIQGD